MELARRRLDGHAVASRIRLRELDAADLADDERHDLIVMNLVLHETGGESRQHGVPRRAYCGLRPGGEIVLSNLPFPDDEASYRSDPVCRRLAGIRLHEEVVGCRAITRQQLRDPLAVAGLVDVRAVDQPRSSRYVAVATKPS